MLAFATPVVLNSNASTLSRVASVSARWAVKKRAAATMVTLPPQFNDGPVLIVKQGLEEGQLGDCPFSQKANLALRARGVDFSVFLVSFANKPDWFKDVNANQSTPTYVVGDDYYTSSGDIVELADKIGSKGTKLLDENEHWTSATNATKDFFPKFAGYMKSKDPEKEQSFKNDLDDVLADINAHLHQVPGRFIVSDNLTAIDCDFAPKMHACILAAKYFKGYTLPFQCSIIKQYMNDIYATDEWKATACTDDIVLWGWSKFFPDGPVTQATKTEPVTQPAPSS